MSRRRIPAMKNLESWDSLHSSQPTRCDCFSGLSYRLGLDIIDWGILQDQDQGPFADLVTHLDLQFLDDTGTR
jgi:hypothetical protein